LGDDQVIHNIGDNFGSLNFANGGLDTDTLTLVVTLAQKNEIDATTIAEDFATIVGTNTLFNFADIKYNLSFDFNLSVRNFEVLELNILPTAVADTNEMTEDEVLVGGDVILGDAFGVGADSDPEEDPLRVTEVNGIALPLLSPIVGSFGTLDINSSGLYTYTRNAIDLNFLKVGESRSDVFTYEITDDNGGFASASLTINITGVNDEPIAVNDLAETFEGIPVLIDVLANDTDVEDDPLTLVSVEYIRATAVALAAAQATRDDALIVRDAAAADLAAAQATFDDALIVRDAAAADLTAAQTDVTAAQTTRDDALIVRDVAAANLAAAKISFIFNPNPTTLAAVTAAEDALGIAQGALDAAQNAVGIAVAALVVAQTDLTAANADLVAAEAALVVAQTDLTAANADLVAAEAALDSAIVDEFNANSTATIVTNELEFNPGSDFDDLAPGETEIVTVSYIMSDVTLDSLEDTAEVTITITGVLNILVDDNNLSAFDGSSIVPIINVRDVSDPSNGLTIDDLNNVISFSIVAGQYQMELFDAGVSSLITFLTPAVATGTQILFSIDNNADGVGTVDFTVILGTDAVIGDPLVGTVADEIIYGFDGNDFINGASGNDILTGGLGNDELTGGLGADTFVYDLALVGGNGDDTILDFDDVIDNDTLEFSNVSDLVDLGTLDIADLLAVSRVVDSGLLVSGGGDNSIKLEIYDQDIGVANDPTGATSVGTIIFDNIGTLDNITAGTTEITDYIDANNIVII